MSNKLPVSYDQDLAKLLSRFTVAPSMMKGGGDQDRPGDINMQSTTGPSMYVLQEIPGKGKGLVATEEIPKGTRILSEEALIIVDETASSKTLLTSICKQVEALSEPQRRVFLSMRNIHPYENAANQYHGIIRTNCLPADVSGYESAIFPEACRINHACDNNAQKSWNERLKRHTVHALRKIEKGEEITITYLSPLMSREVRQKALQRGFGFTCSCRLCSLPAEKSRESDFNLEEIRRLDDVIDQFGPEGILVYQTQLLGYFESQVRLYIKQGREDVGFAQTFVNAAQLVIANGDLARGRVFFERAVSVWKTTIGEDSSQAIRCVALAQDPSRYELYGFSKKWDTQLGEAPRGLEPSDFEDWLWRREKPKPLTQLANASPFTAFVDLPHQEMTSFFGGSIAAASPPQQHWCFVGEILGSIMLHHLELVTRGIGGFEVALHFYTDRLGHELAPARYQKGYTVVLLYAKHYKFKFDVDGIRHEDPRMIKIFPLSLDKFLALNSLVKEFSVAVDGTRICHGCGKKAVSLKQCQKCSCFWYCNTTCQKAGWKGKGHKHDCALLKDADLRRLFLFKWDQFDGCVQFPLPAA
ncbi:hypothetical protein ED733_001284 [Metarhizium rileyi]|uniref:Uncharacterized protein n=1 Tax=Metarhizium rileyi (strain RCEF 4871) TaxID=1649241 RepID=A0A5C6G2V9_METRR|nr:hypothetical protein ED733_001284 [Metarhizium rileyi]